VKGNLGFGKTVLTDLDLDCLSHVPNKFLVFENVISLKENGCLGKKVSSTDIE
jgi:hypothetical protein